jgi:alkyl hydroperoxide reductase subunit AhpC
VALSNPIGGKICIQNRPNFHSYLNNKKQQQNFCSKGTNRKKLKVLYHIDIDFKVICTTKDTSIKEEEEERRRRKKGWGIKREEGCYQ